MVTALFFDVFGTLVDWRSGVAREAEAVLAPLGHRVSGEALADAWRAEYQPSMEGIRAGRAPYVHLDAIHRGNLARILPRFGIPALPDATMEALTLAWHKLDAWPDVTPGLIRLKRRFILAPVSNGNIALMVALARRNGFPWDAILGADLARDYKPKPRVYLDACDALALAPAQCMMVAAHPGDLTAAAANGLRTAYVARPHEHGRDKVDKPPREPADLSAASLAELADRLGA